MAEHSSVIAILGGASCVPHQSCFSHCSASTQQGSWLQKIQQLQCLYAAVLRCGWHAQRNVQTLQMLHRCHPTQSAAVRSVRPCRGRADSSHIAFAAESGTGLAPGRCFSIVALQHALRMSPACSRIAAVQLILWLQ